MPASAFSLAQPEPDIAVLTFDLPGKGVNILSREVVADLATQLDEVEKIEGLAGLIIRSGKPGVFIAGADVREFAASLDAPEEEVIGVSRQGHKLLGRLAAFPFVTVAAIDGLCLGGGSELAIWCDRRVMTGSPKTEFGFPEVKLGLLPGWGGTSRVPRMIGLANAVEMVTGGESIKAKAAYDLGLASDITTSDDLEEAAIRLIRAEQHSNQYLKDRDAWSGPVDMNPTELGFLAITAQAYITQQTHGMYPAPELALEIMLEASGEDLEKALEMEAEAFAKLFGSPENRSLLNVFFLTDRAKRDPGVNDTKLEPAEINAVSVLGAGIMGAGIAAANVKREIPVTIMDPSAEALARGVRGALEEVSYNRATKKTDPERAVKFAPLFNATVSDSELAKCDLLIEAVVEKAEIKKEIFGRLEPQLPESAILASNTSTIPITSLAAGLKRPGQFCGIHFFNPVRRMKLVEVIRGEKTTDQTTVTAVAYAKRLGKLPVVVGDGPGFLVNRLLFPYMSEALALLAEGVPAKDIERAAKKFGMPMGPIELYDMVGLDTALFAGRTMAEAFPERVITSPILETLVEAKRLGKKTGRGFYRYDNKKGKATPDDQLVPLVSPHITLSEDPPTGEALTQRLMLPMLLEATRVLQEKLVRDPRDVDLGLIFGIGFPPFRGGLLFWADTLGAAKILEMLKPFASLGPRYEPTPLLVEMAKNDQKFYEE